MVWPVRPVGAADAEAVGAAELVLAAVAPRAVLVLVQRVAAVRLAVAHPVPRHAGALRRTVVHAAELRLGAAAVHCGRMGRGGGGGGEGVVGEGLLLESSWFSTGGWSWVEKQAHPMNIVS